MNFGGVLDSRIKIVSGDITKVKTQAIVNASNEKLRPDGGVDSAIHEAAGPRLSEECRLLKGCEPGDAKITMGYQLPAEYVIHTVGPVWFGGGRGEDKTLRRCYQRCYEVLLENRLLSIAFPNIATGSLGFPSQINLSNHAICLSII